MKKALLTGFWAALLMTVLTVPAFAQELIVGGQAVGIQITTEGVLVGGLSAVETASGSVSPAEDAGLRTGDLIVSVNGRTVSDAAALMDSIAACDEGECLRIGILRGEKTLTVDVTPAVSDEGRPMLGILLRDGLTGIGTLTFCDPDSGLFGALGHSINDAQTGLTIPVREGSITDAQIVSVRPGASGTPGELSGTSDLGRTLGAIDRNTEEGIFGFMVEQLGGRRLETGSIAAGPASILSTVEGRELREYAVEVNRVYHESDGTHAMLSVTDAELLQKTGGIVQGMSGSPIIQNGKLVGAVTHVFVSDPRRGYALSIQDMLRTAGILDQAA
ncbi:MAG: SpoIVB peptidase [Oscillospiraceae bacterium]|nr:SpoIVB peptidase [Oscillospiraceae bacterium]